MRSPQVAPKRRKSTTLTFTSEELTELAYHLAAGDVFLGEKTPLLLSRVIEAMARSGLKPPPGMQFHQLD